ncbi:MAG: TetR/AcrR family transcriptional regulator [Candidatus Acidiferrales bacterium]
MVARKKSGRPLGRPRAFDAGRALDRALAVFWRKGYEGTAMSDLTRAMRINRPSIYAAFGNKEQLFRKVLDRYTAGPAAYVRQALNEPTARGAIEKLLYGAADALSARGSPHGCLMVQGGLACGEGADPVRRELNVRRAIGEAAVRNRLLRAKAEGELPRGSDAADLARYIVTVMHGMSVEAAGGASRRSLRRVAEMALRAWPKRRERG